MKNLFKFASLICCNTGNKNNSDSDGIELKKEKKKNSSDEENINQSTVDSKASTKEDYFEKNDAQIFPWALKYLCSRSFSTSEDKQLSTPFDLKLQMPKIVDLVDDCNIKISKKKKLESGSIFKKSFKEENSIEFNFQDEYNKTFDSEIECQSSKEKLFYIKKNSYKEK